MTLRRIMPTPDATQPTADLEKRIADLLAQHALHFEKRYSSAPFPEPYACSCGQTFRFLGEYTAHVAAVLMGEYAAHLAAVLRGASGATP